MDNAHAKQIKASLDSLTIEIRNIRKLMEKMIDSKSDEPLPQPSEPLDPIARLEEVL